MVALLVVLTVLVLVLVDVALQRAQARQAVVPAPLASVGALSVPQGLFVDSGHTWFRLESNGHGAVGVDEFAASVLGRVDAVDGPAVGREVRRGDPLFSIRQNGRTATFAAPLDGVVTAVNGHMVENVDSLTADPYRRGWVCRLKPARLGEGLRTLLVGDASESFVRDEVARLREFLGRHHAPSTVGAAAQDGGSLVRGALEHVDDATWDQVAVHFLTPRSTSGQ